ncbi:MAG: type II toxin-antitoxin system RelE/ParE family toxin [Erysipelotrichaceae bacterium]|nr:type II toxin-antitoxin system RelE/ParE family toxin [Erysipelotrichaceae bacterium]
MMWIYRFTKDALNDLGKLDKSQAMQIIKKIRKVAENPLSKAQGGMGIPLGNKYGINLTGCLEVKHKGLGIRAVYKLENDEMVMLVIAVDKREDLQAYLTALSRLDD